MADFISSQPVRTETAGDVVAKLVDTGGVNELAIDAGGRLTSLISDGTNDLDLVVINSAFGATPTAMPIAGKYEATPTTYGDGDATPLLVDANGRLQVDVVSGGGTNTQEDDDDSIAAGQTLDVAIGLGYAYNGATWERVASDGNGNLKVQPTDGTNDLDYVVMNSAFGATPVAMPIAGKYEATPTTYGDGDATPLLVDENGRLQVDVVSGGGTNTQETDDDSIAGGQTLDVAIGLGYAYDGANWERLASNGSGSLNVAVTDALPAGTNNIGDIGTIVDLENTDGAAAGTKGLLSMGIDGSSNAQIISTDTDGSQFVQQRSGDVWSVNITNQTSADEVHDYNQAVAVVKNGGTATHTYTVTAGKTLLLMSVQASASGQGKCTVATGPAASEVDQATFFWSSSKMQEQIWFTKPIEVAAGQNVLLTVTNRDNTDQDIYTFINGEEV